MSLVFLGLSTFFQGYLIVKSTFLPRFLGVVAMVSGLSWLVYLYPALGSVLFYYLIVLAMLGALLTSGWLLVRGVDEQRWREQAHVGLGPLVSEIRQPDVEHLRPPLQLVEHPIGQRLIDLDLRERVCGTPVYAPG